MLQNICVTNDHEYVLFIIITIRLFHNSVMTYHWVCNKSNMKGATSGAGMAYLPWFRTSNYPFSIFKLFLISSKNCSSFYVSVSLPSSTSLELWSTQTDYQVQHLHNYGAHKLITKFKIFTTMEHTNRLPSSTSSQLWRTQTDYQVQHLQNYGTQTNYQVQHLQNYGVHKLITKFNVIRTMEHTN